MIACDIGLDPGNDLHIRCQIMVEDLLAGWFQAGPVVFVPSLTSTLRAVCSPHGTAFSLRLKTCAMTLAVAGTNEDARFSSSSRVSTSTPWAHPSYVPSRCYTCREIRAFCCVLLQDDPRRRCSRGLYSNGHEAFAR